MYHHYQENQHNKCMICLSSCVCVHLYMCPSILICMHTMKWWQYFFYFVFFFGSGWINFLFVLTSNSFTAVLHSSILYSHSNNTLLNFNQECVQWYSWLNVHLSVHTIHSRSKADHITYSLRDNITENRSIISIRSSFLTIQSPSKSVLKDRKSSPLLWKIP